MEPSQSAHLNQSKSEEPTGTSILSKEAEKRVAVIVPVRMGNGWGRGRGRFGAGPPVPMAPAGGAEQCGFRGNGAIDSNSRRPGEEPHPKAESRGRARKNEQRFFRG